jgi:hypothetical protein
MKEPGGGAGGMAEDADKIPGRPVFCVGGREELKTRGGSLSSEGTNAAVQAERSTPLPQYFVSYEFIFMVHATNAECNLYKHHQETAAFQDLRMRT